MAYYKSTTRTNDLEVQNVLPIASINQIALDTNSKLLNFLEANKDINTFKLKWKYELFKYKTYKIEEKLMLNEIKGEKSFSTLRRNGKMYLMSTRIASFLMHFSAMHEIDLLDRLKDFEDMAKFARGFSKNFHNEILDAGGFSKNAVNMYSIWEGILADKEIELNKRFEMQYGKIDRNEKALLRKTSV